MLAASAQGSLNLSLLLDLVLRPRLISKSPDFLLKPFSLNELLREFSVKVIGVQRCPVCRIPCLARRSPAQCSCCTSDDARSILLAPSSCFLASCWDIVEGIHLRNGACSMGLLPACKGRTWLLTWTLMPLRTWTLSFNSPWSLAGVKHHMMGSTFLSLIECVQVLLTEWRSLI